METNPSANIYTKFNNFKKFIRDIQNQTETPTTKGLLSRNMSMKKNMPSMEQNDPFSDAMNFFEAIQNERLKSKVEADKYTMQETNIQSDYDDRQMLKTFDRDVKLYGRVRTPEEEEA
jgi:hypothetical protein